MKCYIKNAASFQTTAQRDTDGFDLCLDSMSGDSSSLSLLGEDKPTDLKRNWLLLNGELWRVAGVSPNKGKTKLKLSPPDTLFDRKLLFATSNAATVGAFIASLITSEWINQSDSVYAASYLTVASTDTTAFEEPETDDNGLYNFLDYIRAMRSKYGVTLHFSLSANTLAVTITKEPVATHPLVAGDGHTQIISSSFSSKALAKVTVFQPVDTGQVDQDNNPIMQTTEAVYYLAADGTVDSTVPLNRASGEWGAILIGKDDDPDAKAEEAFAGNEEARKIELYTDISMKVGDKVKIRINGDVVESIVNGIYRKSGDLRTRYKIGDMITTLTEKVNSLSGGTTTAVKQGGGGGSYILTPQDKQDIADIVLSELPTWAGGSY